MSNDVVKNVETSLAGAVAAVGAEKVQALLDKITGGGNAVVIHEIQVPEAVDHMVQRWGRTLEDTLREHFIVMDNLEKAKAKGIPAEFLQVLNPNEIAATIDQLDAAVQAVVEKGEAKEAAYQEKPQLLRRRTQLETDVKITEAGALMKVQGSGRDQYVVISGEKTYLGNDQARDAYRRMSSKEQREELARINGEVAALDADLQKATDSWYTAKEAADSIRAKANLQAALLSFLAHRG